MKRLAVLLFLGLSGCASDQEDRDFFTHGWVRPEAGANERLYGKPNPDRSGETAERAR